MDKNILIYGAYGYTGRLITQQALSNNLKPILGGRNTDTLKKMAAELQLPYRACGLDGKNELKETLHDVAAVIHAAGPFIHTARPMVESCIETQTHYLDITGEIAVFELCQSYDKKAADAGVMVMPGAGFDVVPSDCLAAYLKSKLPDADRLELAFASLGGGMSRGTAKSVVENLGMGGAVRINGKIKTVPTGHKTKMIDFGQFKSLTVAIPWGDVSTAYRSTGIPNIIVYTGANKQMVRGMKMSNYFNWLLKQRWLKTFMRKKIDQRPAGPTDKQRANSKTSLWGKVKNQSGESKAALLHTPEGYTLTALTSVAIVQRVLEGKFKPGYQTPATAYGPELILEIEGCERQDVT